MSDADQGRVMLAYSCPSCGRVHTHELEPQNLARGVALPPTLRVSMACPCGIRREVELTRPPDEQLHGVLIERREPSAREPAVSTGQKLPKGAHVFKPQQCDRCDAPPRELCLMRISDGLLVTHEPREYKACAECLSDFVSSGLCIVQVLDDQNQWRRVGERVDLA